MQPLGRNAGSSPLWPSPMKRSSGIERNSRRREVCVQAIALVFPGGIILYLEYIGKSILSKMFIHDNDIVCQRDLGFFDLGVPPFFPFPAVITGVPAFR